MTALAVLGLQSCQKMLHTDSTIATFEDNHQLNSASDSVYSVLGVLKNIQAIADQTFLLGELRGDLAALTDTADINLREIANFNFSETNKYNTPTKYYAIINNCNYFLKHADMELMQNNVKVFEREYAAIQGFRAWTYIQLALAYGKVPFVTEPIMSGDIAKADLYPNLTIDQIAEQLIPELEPLVDSKLPSYGTLSGLTSSYFFIPIRLILGDLYLWSGNYVKAAKMYHDYLYNAETGDYSPVYSSKCYWPEKDLNFLDEADGTVSITSSFNDVLCFIPMESSEYNGYVSKLPDIFESTVDNNYYYQATYSNALSRFSVLSKYCYVYADNARKKRTVYVLDSKNYESALALYKGDLRLRGTINISNNSTDESSIFNSKNLTNYKIDGREISLYTLDAVYLRYAEALNRAKMPQAAFCILKYGLCEQNVNKYVPFYERKMASANNLLEFPNQYFQPYEFSPYDDYVYPTYANTMGLHARGSGDAARDPNYVLPMPSEFDIDTLSTRYTDDMTLAEQVAYVDSFWVASLGLDTTSTGKDAVYMTLGKSAKAAYIDSAKTTILQPYAESVLVDIVEKYIVDEMALDLAFEGSRFADLLRIALHRAKESGNGYVDNEFIARHVAARNVFYEAHDSITFYDNNDEKQTVVSQPGFDTELYNKLKGSGNDLNPAMYMSLPE